MARCRHYYGLRTLLARKLRDRFQLSDSLPGVSAQSRGSSVIDHHVTYFDLPLMKALDWAKISGKLSDNILKMQCVCVCVCVCVCSFVGVEVGVGAHSTIYTE